MDDTISITIQYVRACGPVTEEQIAHELKKQSSAVNSKNAIIIARNAIDHGLSTGWLNAYDEDSFCIA
jgi:hypothetical protein